MPKFDVRVTATATVAAIIPVEADSKAEAKKKALKEVREGWDVDWESVGCEDDFEVADDDVIFVPEPLKVEAEVHSDDYRFEIAFNAAKWFEEAADGDIVALAGCGWGGDLPADEVALSFEDTNDEIANLMQYCRATNGRRDSVGFECHVEREPALKWIKKYRSSLLDEIERAEETAGD